MNIWFMIWVFVATFILGTSVWSYLILLKQKRAWEIVSKKCDLRYSSEAVLKSPSLSGVFRGIELDIFSDQPISGKFREGGARTIFQFTLKAPLPSQGMIGSMAFKNFIDGLSVQEKFVGEGSTALLPSLYNRVRSVELMVPYFTKERVSALNAVLNIKNSPAVLIFSQDETLLRIESADPFDDPARLEKFLIKATDAAKIISV
ncbi:MAG TPA: hypothetical protein DCM27_04880 [Rhodospirillaceae bacterium]|nr:hypothetical protein [Rhodospirillaceae bacterium]